MLRRLDQDPDKKNKKDLIKFVKAILISSQNPCVRTYQDPDKKNRKNLIKILSSLVAFLVIPEEIFHDSKFKESFPVLLRILF